MPGYSPGRWCIPRGVSQGGGIPRCVPQGGYPGFKACFIGDYGPFLLARVPEVYPINTARMTPFCTVLVRNGQIRRPCDGEQKGVPRGEKGAERCENGLKVSERGSNLR